MPRQRTNEDNLQFKQRPDEIEAGLLTLTDVNMEDLRGACIAIVRMSRIIATDLERLREDLEGLRAIAESGRVYVTDVHGKKVDL